MQQSLVGRKTRNQAFTLIELLVVIAIISILSAILFPVFARARENARRASCVSNLKQIGLGIMMYTQDYDERLPSSYANNGGDVRNGVRQNFMNYVEPYVKSKQVFKCPSDSGTTYSYSYGYNYVGLAPQGLPSAISIVQIESSAEVVMLMDSYIASSQDYVFPPNNWRALRTDGNGNGRGPVGSFPYEHGAIDNRHLETINILWCDGHVKSQKSDSLVKSIETSGTRNKYFTP